MTRRHLVLVPALAVALAGPSAQAVPAADGSITGAVKATGLSSNADAVVYVQQAPGTFPAPASAGDDGPAQDAVHPSRAPGRRGHAR